MSPVATRPPVFEPTQPLAPLAAWSTAAQVALAGAMLAAIYFGYAILIERTALVDIRGGIDISLDRATQVDGLVTRASVVVLVAELACAAVFITWFYKAYRNLDRLKAAQYRPGWAIGGWFVPFLNLWRPYQLARELAAGGAVQRLDRTRRIVVVWWITWAGSMLISRAASSMGGDSLDGAIAADTAWLGFAVLQVVAGVAAIGTVRTITAAQTAHSDG